MALGTAGLTAMLCVLALERQGLGTRTDGTVLVTGAGGGVGSVAVAVLSRLGYQVTASTGRPDIHGYLRALGATAVVGRHELADPGRPLATERWAAAVDTVGSVALATVLSQVRYGGAVAACGLAAGNDLPTTVLPFILRNVSLLGIDSVWCPLPMREAAWGRLERDLPADVVDAMSTIEPLARVVDLGTEILAGRTRGRVVIDTSA
jgi:acrylyl-CoA reductase (NADPH)